MDPVTGAAAEKEFKQALKELELGNVLAALACLEKALNIWDDPHWYSRLGFCITKERGHATKGFELCRIAIEREPEDPDHYFYLGKTHLVAGNSAEALQALRQGMAQGGNAEIERLLAEIGTRKPPVIRFLSRDNILNKYLGIILKNLRLR